MKTLLLPVWVVAGVVLMAARMAAQDAPKKFDTPPKMVGELKVKYPDAMQYSGMRGEVVVEFVVNEKGAAENAVVLRTSNPAFNEEAVKAVMKLKFKPATKDGVPTEVRMKLPIAFEVQEGRRNVGTDYASVKDAANTQESMPPQYRYDVAPQPLAVCVPVYPYEAARGNVSGKASVLMLIDEAGQVVQVKVTEATLPEFGLALLAAAEMHRFRPALRGGLPTQTVIKMSRDFSDDEVLSGADKALLKLEAKQPEKIVAEEKLDVPLQPFSQKQPVFPPTARGRFDRSEALIELLVDKQGKARLPRIVSATDPVFGYAAVQASSEWLYETPRAGGRAVVARIRVAVVFGPEKSKATISPAAESADGAGL